MEFKRFLKKSASLKQNERSSNRAD